MNLFPNSNSNGERKARNSNKRANIVEGRIRFTVDVDRYISVKGCSIHNDNDDRKDRSSVVKLGNCVQSFADASSFHLYSPFSSSVYSSNSGIHRYFVTRAIIVRDPMILCQVKNRDNCERKKDRPITSEIVS